MKRMMMVAVLLFWIGAGRADEYARESLEGMEGVRVLIEGIDSDVEKAGLKEAQLQADVEEQLRQAGIRVLAHGEWMQTPGGQYLYVSVNAVPEPRIDAHAYFLRVELRQDVFLARATSIKAIGAATWRESKVGIAPSDTMPRSIRASVDGLVGEFIADYRAANPSTGAE